MYSARTPSGGRYRFGTSGLLYRSNKLMFDRETFTLFENLTGEPVVGSLVGTAPPLRVLPVAVTTWGGWKTLHPDTTVLLLPSGYGARWNYDYQPGAADRARKGVSFPIWQKSAALPEKEEVFALRAGNRAKAYPVEAVLRDRVINDEVGGESLVLLGDRKSGAVRAYKRGSLRFRPGASDGELLDESGAVWVVEEEALRRRGQAPDKADTLTRLPGHNSFWFGWFGFYPDTEVYGQKEKGN